MRLTLGITELLPQWQLVLNQIGIPLEPVNSLYNAALEKYAALVITERTTQHEKEAFLHYLSQGGSVLVEADVAEWLLGISTVPAYVKYVETVEDSIFQDISPGYIDCSLILPSQGSVLSSDSGKKLVHILQYGKGTAVILPGFFVRAILNTQVKRRNFPTPGPLPPSERITKRSKQTIRLIIQRSLEYLYFTRELPFVTLWPFPKGEKTVFNLRIDTDFSSQEEVDTLYRICHQYEIPATWFVETQSAQDWIGYFAKMENQEIGLHCNKHRVFRGFNKNENNLKLGLRFLRNEKIRVQGYAAPFGEWNIPLAKAIEHHGFLYSSEFTLNYDDLPFYPYLRDRFSSVLQVPVHPISTARLRNAHHSEDHMKAYFTELIKEKTALHQPVFIYDHPSNGNLDVLSWIFEYIRNQGIFAISLVDYAQWWTKRIAMEWSANLDGNKLSISSFHADPSIWISVKKSENEITVVPLETEIDLQNVEWKSPGKRNNTKFSMAQLNKFYYKMFVNDMEHFYWKFRS